MTPKKSDQLHPGASNASARYFSALDAGFPLRILFSSAMNTHPGRSFNRKMEVDRDHRPNFGRRPAGVKAQLERPVRYEIRLITGVCRPRDGIVRSGLPRPAYLWVIARVARGAQGC
jgi:hypothetical protein